jgi:hypothetical protein
MGGKAEAYITRFLNLLASELSLSRRFVTTIEAEPGNMGKLLKRFTSQFFLNPAQLAQQPC